jgi:hypothetical protein
MSSGVSGTKGRRAAAADAGDYDDELASLNGFDSGSVKVNGREFDDASPGRAAAPPRKKQKRNKPTLSCEECVERKTKVRLNAFTYICNTTVLGLFASFR